MFFGVTNSMNWRFPTLIALLTLIVAPLPAAAQDGDTRSDAELMTQQYVASYDSLMNTYYMRRMAGKRGHGSLAEERSLERMLEEFDALPDSVLEGRLRRLHTVIPMTYNSDVRSHIRFYLKVMSRRLDVMLTLSEYYHPLFEEGLARYGVPEELKYLTIVESAMNPMATSRVGAAGLWQFMYSTGKLYGLEVNSVVDDRRDPYKSTVAAARFIKDLHNVFGDWTLAIAAYNCGPGNINKAMARSGRRDFWGMYGYLPRETRGYVPAFIAAVYVMNYYDKHGLHPVQFNLPIRSDTVMLDRDVLFTYVCQATGLEMDELRSLNPQYRVDYIPASTEPYSLCLPMGKIEAFLQMQDSVYAKSRDSLDRKPVKVEPRAASGGSGGSGGSKYYTVRKGDTLSKIASKHGISVSTLKKRNGLRGDKIRVGQKLKIR